MSNLSDIFEYHKEVIKQEIKVAEESQKVVDTHIVFTDEDGNDVSVEEMYADDTEIIYAHLLNYQLCADYHKFIAEQLKKLEKIEQIFEIKGFGEYPCTYEDMCREVIKIVKG